MPDTVLGPCIYLFLEGSCIICEILEKYKVGVVEFLFEGVTLGSVDCI